MKAKKINLQELEDSPTFNSILPTRGRVLSHLSDFIEQVDDTFHRLHATAYVMEKIGGEYKDHQIEAIVNTVRAHINGFVRKGTIQPTGHKALGYKLDFYRRVENED